MKINKLYMLLPLVVGVSLGFLSISSNSMGQKSLKSELSDKYETHYEYLPFIDTVYVLGNEFVYISLKSQKATIYRRKDTSITFKISSGNDRIKEGISTNIGLFTVQTKSPLAISKQFDDAELFNWIGFNGNIGFHGLKGNGYYRTLGLRPSSHGCVRIAREDGEVLYKLVRRGTPILVYDDEPARILTFSKDTIIKGKNTISLLGKSMDQRILLNNRLKNLYTGKANLANKAKIFMDGKTILRPGGYDIGIASNIALRQEVIGFDIDKYESKKDLSFKYLRRVFLEKKK